MSLQKLTSFDVVYRGVWPLETCTKVRDVVQNEQFYVVSLHHPIEVDKKLLIVSYSLNENDLYVAADSLVRNDLFVSFKEAGLHF